MVDSLHSIYSIKNLINNNILPQLDFLESQFFIADDSGLKLLSEVACSLSENNSNKQCYARTSKATRCTNNIANPSDNELDISNMYCKQHCMTCERTTRNKPENTLPYGDVRLIGENCIAKSCNDKKFIKYMTNNKLLSDKLRISNNYTNVSNKELYNRLYSICVT